MTKKLKNNGSIWHEGEKSLHQHLNISKQMEDIGARMVRSYMPQQHRDFFEQLPFIVAGSVDETGDVWATLLSGKPGFITSPSEKQLDISSLVASSDPASRGFKAGDSVGLLGIELHTRRRNRMNGIIGKSKNDGLSVRVGHSFGNCPQYIQLRTYELVRDPKVDSTVSVEKFENLTPDLKNIICKADTFFVSSYIDLDDDRQVDVSHRGGKPGFIRVDADGTLTIPDFAGNLIFNTLGNFLKNPKAGLVFPNFETGDVLQLTGDAEVILSSPEIEAFDGAERLWTFKPRKVVHSKNALPIRWSFNEYSPNVLLAGSWEQAQKRLDAETKKLEWRDFKVTSIIDESSVIKSFWLEPIDGDGVVRHQAGQHLPIQLDIPTENKPVLRTYTLSTAPSDNAYRISVKCDGLASKHLHNHIKQGDIIKARAPQGHFIIDAKEKRPIVMLAAGVGITPFISMMRHLAYEGKRTRLYREAWLFQAASTFPERAFDKELEELAGAADGKFRITRLLSETDEPHNVLKGLQTRLSTDVLKAVLPFDDYDFYLCGPSSFMESLYNQLRDMKISDSRIFFEAFGPASVTRSPDFPTEEKPKTKPAQNAVDVSLVKSAKTITWTPEYGSLLEATEKNGLSPNYSCRIGSCGACKIKILNGKVAYTSKPTHPVKDDEALICCSVPAADKSGTKLKLEL